jgi:GNAT superfamily N-acetyltransferase
MDVIKIRDEDKENYIDMLLLADEQESMINKYLYRGEVFVLCDSGVKSICVVTKESSYSYEIKNIATDPQHRGKGYGRFLIEFVINHYKDVGDTLYVGTGDSLDILNFYGGCGFSRSHIVKNFFTDNYDHPIYDNGNLLTDMVYLKMALK